MLVGQKFGPFAIETELGSGAMGVVYKAWHADKQKYYAIKIIAPGVGENERVMARFEREIEMLRQLDHPNIVKCYGFGRDPKTKTRFCVMEFIEGGTLADQLERRQRFTWEEVVDLGKQMCDALYHAHAKGIIHRDLKPSNFMLDKDGVVKLTDFGIAKDLDTTALTSANCTVGTAAYMSPEQCKGEKNLTHQSDVYSLGIVFYELLTGHKPFFAENAMEMFLLHVNGAFERPSRHVMDIPVWLDTLVCHMLEKKAEHRPVDMKMVGQVLSEVRDKVETLQSAGMDVASATVRKSRNETDRQAARSMIEGKRGKKRKKKPIDKELVFKAVGAVIGLLGVIALVAVIVWPKPEKAYREGVKLVERGDALIESGQPDEAQAIWYDADYKFLGPIAADPDHPFAGEAKKQLDHIKSGTLYLKGHRILEDKRKDKKDWKPAKGDKDYGDYKRLLDLYYQLLDGFPPDNKFAMKARADLEPLDAPDLLEEAREMAAIDDDRRWPDARTKLTKLIRYHAGSSHAKEAQDILDRLEATFRALARIDESKKTGVPWSTLNKAEELSIKAVELEFAKRDKDAIVLWKQVEKMPATEPEFRPWVLLAKEKLKAKMEK